MTFAPPSPPSAARPRVRLTWTMSKPPEPSPRSSACTFTMTSSPTSTGPRSATSAIAGPRRPSLGGASALVDRVRRRGALDADIDVALALGPIGQLVSARDHLGRQRLHMLLVHIPEHRLHGQGGGCTRGGATAAAILRQR